MTAPNVFDPIKPKGFTYVLPRLQPIEPQRGLVTSALRTGFNEAQATLGSAAEAAGVRLGLPSLAEWGRKEAVAQQAEADQYRRTDLEALPWRGGNASLPAFAAYQVLKQVPQTVGRIGTAVAGGLAGTAIGAAGGPAGIVAGGVLGAAAGIAPSAAMAVGSLYQEGREGGLTPEEAARQSTGLKAAAYTALDVAQIGRLRGLAAPVAAVVKDVAKPGALRRVAGAALKEAGSEFVQEGAQTALEMTMRPDLSTQDKLQRVVDGAIVGGMVGGVFGATASAMQRPAREVQTKPAATVTNDELAQTVEKAVAQPPIPPRAALPAGSYQMGPVGSTSTAPQDLTPQMQEGPDLPDVMVPAPPRVPTSAPAGTQGELFGDTPSISQPTPAAAPEPAPRAPEPVYDPRQQVLFEDMDPDVANAIQDMQYLAREAAGRASPFVKSLTAKNPVELVMQVQDALAKPRPPAAAIKMGQTFGLVDAAGQPRNLAAEIERETKKLWRLAPKVETSKAARTRFEAQQQIVRTLQMQQEVLDVVAQQRSAATAPETAPVALETAPAAPAAPAAPVAEAAPVETPVEPAAAPAPIVVDVPAAPVELSREQQVQQMRDRARQIVGRRTAFIAKLDAATDEEMRTAILSRLEKGSAAADTMKLAEAFGIDPMAPAPAPAPAVAPPPVDAEEISDPRGVMVPPGSPVPIGRPVRVPAPVVGAEPPADVGNMPIEQYLATLYPDGTRRLQPEELDRTALKALQRKTMFTDLGKLSDRQLDIELTAREMAESEDVGLAQLLESPPIEEISAAGKGGKRPRTTAEGRSLGLDLTEDQIGAIEAAGYDVDTFRQQYREARKAASRQRMRAPMLEALRAERQRREAGLPDSVVRTPVPRRSKTSTEAPVVREEMPEEAAPAAPEPTTPPAATVGTTGPVLETPTPAAPAAEPAPQVATPADAPDESTPTTDTGKQAMPPRTRIASWTKKFDVSSYGTVIFANKDFALIRGVRNELYSGQVAYLPLLPNGKIFRLDLSNGEPFGYDAFRKANNISDAMNVRIREEVTRAMQAEQYLETQHPDGPFTGATNAVVGDALVDFGYVQYAKDLLEAVGLGSVRVFITSQNSDPSVRDTHKLYGSYATALSARMGRGRKYGSTRTFGPNNMDHYIALDTSLPSAVQLEVLSHEIGHIIYKTAFENAPVDVRKAVIDAYDQWRVGAEKLSGPKLFAATRPAAQTQREMPTLQKNEQAGFDINNREYYLSFEEWFADQVARWATTDKKPQSIVDKFFAKIWDQIDKLVQAFYKRGYVNAEMKKFLDGMMAAREAGLALEWAAKAQQAARQGQQPADSPENANLRVQQMVGAVKDIPSKLKNWASLSEAMRKEALGWSSMTHMAAQFKTMFDLGGEALNGLEMLPEVEQARSSTGAHFAQLHDKAYTAFKALEKENAKLAEVVGILMRYTEHDVDPAKSWEDHTWLHEYETLPNGKQRRVDDPRLVEIVAKANEHWRMLKRAGKQEIYENFKYANETIHYAQFAMDLYTTIVTDPAFRGMGLEGFTESPVEAFKQPGTGRAESIKNAREFWHDLLKTQLNTIETLYAAEMGMATTLDPKGQAEVEARLRPLRAQANMAKVAMERMEQAPYFHLGRTGDYFVSFAMRTIRPQAGKPRVVDPVAMDKVAEALEQAGIVGVEMSRDSTRPNAYMRFESQEAADAAYKVVLALQQQGYIQREGEVLNAPGEAESVGIAPRKGKRTSEAPVSVSPRWVQRIITDIESSTAFQISDDMTPEQKDEIRKHRDQMVRKVREIAIDMLPDMSITKVLTQRKAVPGYNRDMIQNFAQRMQIGTLTLANLSAEPQKLEAFSNMKAAINMKQTDPATSLADVVTMQDVYGELVRRDAERPMRTGKSLLDTWRAFNHAYFLGLSPAYTLVNLSQIGVLLWPELAKTHGFVGAAKAIAKVTPLAFRILNATLQSGWAAGQAADAIVTEEVLAKAGVPKATAEFIMRMVNTGAIDMGSASRELGRVAEGEIDSGVNRGLRYAASFGYYSETVTRLISALAARELHGEQQGTAKLDKYARATINESMFNYSSWNTPRKTGKMGIAGPFSPIMFSFMTYQFQLLEKLYREVGTAFIEQAKSPDERQAARRFLGAHLTAVTVVAGTLGLPFASVAARGIEALKDLLDDDEEPYDAKAAWRNFLADLFGKDAAEILSRGAPRAFGIDISTRAGEQDILPFSRLLTDRRSWADASKDWAMSALGSPVSMLSNIVAGGAEVANGNVLSGMDKMLPTALKGPERAFRLTTEGYTDASGNRLPMTPGAAAILAQAVGFTPAAKAEYSEANQTQKVRKGVLTQRASVIRRQLALAYERQDREALREGLREARQFDEANPGYAILPGLPEVIRRRAKARQMSRLTLTPLGTNVRDTGTRQLTEFANF